MNEDKVMERVRLLLARAEHPNTPAPEAELALKQANKLMVKHAIDEAQLDSEDPSRKRIPVRRDIKVGYDSAGEFWPQMRTILAEIAEANRCRALYGADTLHIFGFRDDVSWSEMLYTTILTDFVSKVNPRWDESLGFEQNIYNFKVAGYRWQDIDYMARSHGHPSSETMKEREVYDHWDEDNKRAVYKTALVPTGYYHKLHRIYKRKAKELGDENLVKTTSFQQYREQFTQAFTEQISNRLRGMKADSEEAVASTTGAELVLADVSQRVNEFMWSEFPEMHPDEQKRRREAYRAQKEQEAQEREEMLAAMTPAQRAKFLDKEERERRKANRQGKVRYVRYQSAAADRGRAAADSVDLSRKRHAGASAPKRSLQ